MIVNQVSVVQLIFIDIYQRIKCRRCSAGPIINHPAILVVTFRKSVVRVKPTAFPNESRLEYLEFVN